MNGTVSVNASDAVRALRQCKHVAPGKSTLPVLSHALVSARVNGLTFTVTDLDTALEYTVDTGYAGPCGPLACVPLKSFVDTLAGFGSAGVTLTFDGDTVVVASGNGGTAKLPTFPAEEFPCLPAVPPYSLAEFAPDVLARTVEAVLPFVSRDETRPSLNGVLFEFAAPEGFRVVATDGHRLAVHSASPLFVSEETPNAIVPPAALKVLGALLKKHPDKVEYRAGGIGTKLGRGAHCKFVSGDWVLASRLAEGPFPDYRQILPKGNGQWFTTTVDALLPHVKALAPLTDKVTHRVRFNVSDAGLDLSVSVPNVGESRRHLTCATAGTLEMGFSAKYLLDILKVAPDKRAPFNMHFSGPVSAATLDYGDAATDTVILMPLRLS